METQAQHSPSEKLRQLKLDCLRILDTGAEPMFDDITRLASQTFGMPIALISLIDKDRQWFKSRVGLKVAQISREVAFCDRAIRNASEVFVVEDAHADPAFRANPLVTGDPHIRFYAGAPMVTSGGAALGTVCVIDSKPRSFSAVEMEQLRLFSRLAITQIELRRASSELLRTGHELAESNRMLVERIEKAEKQSLIDPVTGAYNRRYFDTSLLTHLLRVRSHGGDVSLLLCELDNFKLVNEVYGQDAADRLLRLSSSVMRSMLRAEYELLRISDEGFAIIAPGAADVDAIMLAERITQRIRETRFSHGRLSMSAGLASFDAARPDRDLHRLAEQGLRIAKTEGQDRVGPPID